MSPASNTPLTDPLQSLLNGALDELDYGVILVDCDGHVHYVSRAASAQLAQGHPLSVREQRICIRGESNSRTLRAALLSATLRAMRRLVALELDHARFSVSVVPVAQPAGTGKSAAMLVLGRRAPCTALSAYGFAACCGLSDAEASVLSRLVEGDGPAEIAIFHRVSVNTVRTQIMSIRAKSGVDSIRSLIRELAMLPPLVSVLGCDSGSAQFETQRLSA